MRPAESYAIVFLGADVLRDADELGLAERGIWQTLAGEPDVRWAGQDLADHRCLMWAEALEEGHFLSGRIERDGQILKQWLRAPVADGDALAAQRANHVLELAEQETSLAAGAAQAERFQDESARFRDTQRLLQELKPRLFSRLDAQAAQLDQDITSSLDQLRGHMLRQIHDRIRLRGDVLWNDAQLRPEIEDVVRQGMDNWREEIAATLEGRWQQAVDAAVSLFRGVDWEPVNAATAGREVTYPDAILVHLRAGGNAGLEIGDGVVRAGPTGLPDPDPRGRVFWMAASGAALAAVAALVAGPALVPVAAAGAAGAMGGRLAERHFGARSNHQAAEERARADVSHALSRARDAARSQIRSAFGSARQAMLVDFRMLDDELHIALLQQAAGPATGTGPTSADTDQAKVAELRRRLDSALT